MRDRYIEHFVFLESTALDLLVKLRSAYSNTGMYQVGSSYVVWAEREEVAE